MSVSSSCAMIFGSSDLAKQYYVSSSCAKIATTDLCEISRTFINVKLLDTIYKYLFGIYQTTRSDEPNIFFQKKTSNTENRIELIFRCCRFGRI
jgi:hypothetical protein